MKKCLLLSKKFSAFLMVFALLFVSAFSVIVFVKGATEPDCLYTVVQDFEGMTEDKNVTDYYNSSSVELGCTGTLSLSADGGFGGSKAVKYVFSLNNLSSWGRINTNSNNLTLSGEGLSFWINVDQPMRIKALAWYNWVQYSHDLITLEPGDHFVQIPWGDFKGKEEWAPYNDVVLEPNQPTKNLRIGFTIFPAADELTAGTAYIDQIGYVNQGQVIPTVATTTTESTATTTTESTATTTTESVATTTTTTGPTEPHVDIEPGLPYGLHQGFESMTVDKDVQDYYEHSSVAENCTGTLSLSTNRGYKGSKAVQYDFSINEASSWGRIDTQVANINSKADGLSFWINVDQPMRIKALAWYNWVQYSHDLITLEPGDHFIQIPWGDFKGKEEWAPYNDVVLEPNQPDRNIRLGFMIHPVEVAEGEVCQGTLYIDEIGYINGEDTVTTPTPPRPDDAGDVLFYATKGVSPWPNLQGNPAYLNIFKVDDDPRFEFYHKMSILEDFKEGGLLFFNNVRGLNTIEYADISYGYEEGYVRFWVKASDTKSFSTCFTSTDDIPSSEYIVKIEEANVWQEVRIPLSEYTFSSPAFAKTARAFTVAGNHIGDEPGFEVGDTIKIADIKVYIGEPEDIEVPEGFDNDPENAALSYPVGTKDDSRILWQTDFDLDYVITDDGAGTLDIEDSDELEGFNQIYKFVVGSEFKRGYQGLYLYGEPGDIKDYLDTGYMSFFVKASKAGAPLMFSLYDDAGSYGPRHIFYVDKANEWIEFRIPLKVLASFQDLEYINNIFLSDTYLPYTWSYENLVDEGNPGDGYFREGDTLYFSPFFIKAGIDEADFNDDEDDEDDGTGGGKDKKGGADTGDNSTLPIAIASFVTLSVCVASYKRIKAKKYSLPF